MMDGATRGARRGKVGLAVVGLVLAATAVAVWAQAQPPPGLTWEPGKRVVQCFMKCLGAAEKAAAGGALGYAPGVSLFAAMLEPGASASIDLPLKPGNYRVFACGDSPTAEVTLLVEAGGNELASASGEIADARLRVAEGTEDLTMTLDLSETAKPSLCGVFILKAGGPALSAKTVGMAVGRLVSIGQTAENDGTKVGLNDAPESWCLFGALLGARATAAASPLSLPKGEHVLAATGSAPEANVTVWLADVEGKKLTEDPEASPMVVVPFECEEGDDYQAAARNQSSTDGLFVIWAIAKAE